VIKIKTLPENVQALENIEFNEIRKADNLIKSIKKAIIKINKKEKKGKFERLIKRLDKAEQHLKRFAEALDMEYGILKEIKSDIKDLVKKFG